MITVKVATKKKKSHICQNNMTLIFLSNQDIMIKWYALITKPLDYMGIIDFLTTTLNATAF